ncbi:MAG: hypothetical protein NTW37_22450 [Proteobacteria bacterium]|nr:hypothetical protein [Pseudomonadota bacterium]
MSLQGVSPARASPRGRFAWANWTTSFAHVSLLAWAGNYRRWRLIVDTPTSRIGSAAQGYVELAGTAHWPGDAPLTSELAGVPCCWYWFKVERKGARDHWSQERDGESFVPFVLDDGSGQCIVHPAEAEVHSHRRKTWIEGDRRFTEVTILPDDRLYAIGAFSTHQPLDGEAAVRAEIAALVVKWKSDPLALLERFDLDRDGTIDLDEWQLARRQARREVERDRQGRPRPPAVHVMRGPKDGRLFMLSNLDPEALGRRYLRWKWFHLCAFLASLGIGSWLLLH